ncbi:MAG: hypothetical protein WC822_02485 [Candidatus Paceibacterota bacterium]|jgi:hypothetical protein
MRCPDCNKFVGNDQQDPEVDDITIDADGHINVTVRIVNACDQCGTELTEAVLELEDDIAELVEHHKGEGHELEIEDDNAERTERCEGKGRGRRTFYGASVHYRVTCSCGRLKHSDVLEDDVQASAMDSLA